VATGAAEANLATPTAASSNISISVVKMAEIISLVEATISSSSKERSPTTMLLPLAMVATSSNNSSSNQDPRLPINLASQLAVLDIASITLSSSTELCPLT